jgi:hypothetical protein
MPRSEPFELAGLRASVTSIDVHLRNLMAEMGRVRKRTKSRGESGDVSHAQRPLEREALAQLAVLCTSCCSQDGPSVRKPSDAPVGTPGKGNVS